MNIKSEITKLHYSSKKNALYHILAIPTFFYSLITNTRNFLYDKNILKSEKVDANVVAVGNLTTGGVGKTPVVAEIAKYYLNLGEKTAVISRGYGGKLSSKNVNVISDGENIFYEAKMAGDEPFWYAENIKGLIVITCSLRVKAAKYAIEHFGVQNIILDDAFQHRKIQRDKNILLIDSEKRFGNAKQLPQGPLRESVENLKRADKIVIMSKGSNNYENVIEFAKELNATICDAGPAEVYNIKTGVHLANGVTATAVCAIGQPEQFFNFLTPRFNIVEKVVFDDHHSYSKKELENIKMPIITTEKDAVKIKDFDLDNVYALKLRLSLNCRELLND